ncbi:polysaccharide deacetylase family protein [Amycolatopsis sp. NPDC059657]|uniref:polysaccharide deacetylase family protein n=1 Tax=Amycolatopsis sp. NPDC059657 TaxID=3346899 RepID=UPI0036718161
MFAALTIATVTALTSLTAPVAAPAETGCGQYVALTFDDGPSYYRPQTLRVLRDKRVHATFFDNGVRVDANPRLPAFQVAEGHVQLSHTYLHPFLPELPAAAVVKEVRRTEEALASAGAPLTFKGVRPPYTVADPPTRATLTSLGYSIFAREDGEWIYAEDWNPARTAAEIRDAILAGLRPGALIGLHDGPIDTPAGAATVAAVPQIIDGARALGYCFGVVGADGRVAPDEYTPSTRNVPRIGNPVPYLPLVYPGNVPGSYEFIRSPLSLKAGHFPAVFQAGGTGVFRATLGSLGREGADGSVQTVAVELPEGLALVKAAGQGWTCANDRCTRNDVLAPHKAYPPIDFTVSVAPGATGKLAATVNSQGHGGSWQSWDVEEVRVR